MTTTRDDVFHPITMAAARLVTGEWQKRAACRADLRFLTRPIPEQLAVCHGCPVMAQCQSFGMCPEESDTDRRRSVFPCGHPRVGENVVKNGRRPSGAQIVLCKTCRDARRQDVA